jgi:hypothetical protein
MGKTAVRILLEEISWKEHAAMGKGRNGRHADRNVLTARAEETVNAAVCEEATGGRRVVILEPRLIVRKTSLVSHPQ